MAIDPRRAEAIRLYRDENLTVKQVAARLRVRSSTVGVWLREHYDKQIVVTSIRTQFEEIVNRIGIETALDWMGEITREHGRSLRTAANAMEIANEQIAQVLERTRHAIASTRERGVPTRPELPHDIQHEHRAGNAHRIRGRRAG